MSAISMRMKILLGLAGVLAVVMVIQYVLPTGSDPTETTPEPGTPTQVSEDNDPNSSTPAGTPAAPAAGTPYRHLFQIAKQPRPEDLPVLKKEIRSPSWKNRHAAVVATGRLKEEGDPPGILAVLTNPDEVPQVRAAAAEQLGEMRHIQAGAALLDAMSDPSALVRAAAGVAITKIMGIRVDFHARDSIARREAAVRRARNRWEMFQKYHK